jgi:error-prone DNA polymerase
MAGYAELGARSNFSLLDGASHPAELVAQARALGHAGIGICDQNSLAGVVRGHVAALELGLPFVVGARLRLTDGAEYLAWPTDRRSYGRLTTLLSRGRMRAPKGMCAIGREELLEHAEGWCLALLPPARPGSHFADRLQQDALALRDRLALPLFCAAWCRLDGEDQPRLDRLAAMAEAAGAALLAAGDVRYHHRDRRRLADVLTAIRLGRTVETLGRAAERNGERALRSLVPTSLPHRHGLQSQANSEYSRNGCSLRRPIQGSSSGQTATPFRRKEAAAARSAIRGCTTLPHIGLLVSCPLGSQWGH